MTATDFRNSYMIWSVPHDPSDTRKPGHKPWGNWARILLEARCVLTECGTAKSDEFFLIAACRTEWVYQERGMFQIPSAEYRGIWSRDRHMSTGYGIIAHTGPKASGATEDQFTSLKFTIRQYPQVTVLETDDAVVEATDRELPLVAQTEIWSEDEAWHAMIEYPIKTMNFHLERRRFQVDTGPILLPDFSSPAEQWIERFDMAHVAYNTLDHAEFIIRRPTPVVVDGVEVCEVEHYSEIREHAARHTMLCAGEPGNG